MLDSDDDRTRLVMPEATSVALRSGVRLRDFEIEGVIGEGGFGIVYVARDLQLERRVAIKEYLPTSLATRGEGVSVVIRPGHQDGAFEAGRRSFLNEARLLARFDHASLVKVHQFWDSHNTAYMVMPLYEGQTLKQYLRDRPAPSELELLGWLQPLLEVLEMLHRAQCFHRDIAPDNILLLEDGRPLLLDFGAARHIVADQTNSLTVILKSGYAPIEQYAQSTALKQGPWTDIYALCAVLYFAIIGRALPPSVSRLVDDGVEPLATTCAGQYSDDFLRAIDAGLAVRPDQRPQSVAALRDLFGIPAAPPTIAASIAKHAPSTLRTTRPQPQVSPPETIASRARHRVVWIAIGAFVVAASGVALWFATARQELPAPVESSRPAPSAPPVPSAEVPATSPTQSPPVPVPALPPSPPKAQRAKTPASEVEVGKEPPRKRGAQDCRLDALQRLQLGEVTPDRYRELLARCE